MNPLHVEVKSVRTLLLQKSQFQSVHMDILNTSSPQITTHDGIVTLENSEGMVHVKHFVNVTDDTTVTTDLTHSSTRSFPCCPVLVSRRRGSSILKICRGSLV